MPEIWSDIRNLLDKITEAGLRRNLRFADDAAGTLITYGRDTLVNFSSNNYLDLAGHPRVTAAAARAITKYGVGAGGSRLICGSMKPHQELEEELARFKGTESALVFSSGYLANIGLIQGLALRSDGTRIPIYFDRLAHASIVDAVLASGSPWHSFAHNDVNAVETLLKRAAGAGRAAAGSPTAMVVTEGVFSMDGDLAPLPELVALCDTYGALLIVDDAHGTGTIGPGGRGSAAYHRVSNAPNLVQMGTLSKALGSSGGFVAGPRILCDLLVSRARGFIFDTALAPACAAAAFEALQILRDEPRKVGLLLENALYLRNELRSRRLPVADSFTPIVPIAVGDAGKAVDAAENLRKAGLFVVAIRPPTVPKGTSRLRLTVMVSHTKEQLRIVADALAAERIGR